jgi:hypothetical protein
MIPVSAGGDWYARGVGWANKHASEGGAACEINKIPTSRHLGGLV